MVEESDTVEYDTNELEEGERPGKGDAIILETNDESDEPEVSEKPEEVEKDESQDEDEVLGEGEKESRNAVVHHTTETSTKEDDMLICEHCDERVDTEENNLRKGDVCPRCTYGYLM